MTKHDHAGVRRFQNDDLVLNVSSSIDRNKWDEDKYEPFIDELCGEREYQKEAIRVALRYLLGGEYSDLRDLAANNFERSDILRDKYGSFSSMERHLQLPDKLSASLDLATATGKSYVMYGIAAIMLAEGAVDRVLVLCPSTTIETGLIEKFEEMAGDANLQDLLPDDAVINAPEIINASRSIVSGSICVENYHAILAHVRSSIRDSLQEKGSRTLVLNDETHHVVNEAAGKAKKWKEFLTDPIFDFRYIIGLSGTCYIGDEYFSDVIFRYSLRKAMDQAFVKKIHYLTESEMPQSRQPEEEKWQVVHERHEEIRKGLKSHKLRPLTIIITRDIQGCKDVAEKFKAFLQEQTGKSREQVDEQILVIHSDAPDLPRLAAVNNATNKVEWIFSVSMLNEGWDVKRVFQIVPHEKKAFDSKLLIAQVLGRGLRKPEGWSGDQPVVTVFNHDKWADSIRHLVHEVMEDEKRIPTMPVLDSPFNFELINIEYDPKPRIEKYPMGQKYNLLDKGYVDLSMEQPVEELKFEFEEANTGRRIHWKTRIKHKTYSTRDIAEVMYQRFEDLPIDEDRKYYAKQFPVKKLEEIIDLSLKKSHNKAITENIRQKFLQSLGTLHRKEAQNVRYDFEAVNYHFTSTSSRPQEGASASDLRDGKTLFYTNNTEDSIPDDAKQFFYEATESGSGFKCVPVLNRYDFKTPLNAVIADHDNERRFVKELVSSENAKHIDAWIKSTPIGFYDIDYSWKKGEHPKRGKFNPDFFIKAGKLILVAEIKDDGEIAEPAIENKKKSEYALKHFGRVNAHLKKDRARTVYQFNFLTPSDFGRYFQSIRDGEVEGFRSELDVALAE